MGKGVTLFPSSNPTASRGFCLDGVWGPVCTTQKVPIPPFGTVSIHSNTGVQGHYMWVHMLAKPTQGPQSPVSMVPTATYGELHLGSSCIPICLRNLSAQPTEVSTRVIIGKVTPANQEQARELLLKWEHLFACSDLDQGKTSLIKHWIKFTDLSPFKECY